MDTRFLHSWKLKHSNAVHIACMVFLARICSYDDMWLTWQGDDMRSFILMQSLDFVTTFKYPPLLAGQIKWDSRPHYNVDQYYILPMATQYRIQDAGLTLNSRETFMGRLLWVLRGRMTVGYYALSSVILNQIHVTHWGRNNLATVLHNAFSNDNWCILMENSTEVLPKLHHCLTSKLAKYRILCATANQMRCCLNKVKKDRKHGKHATCLAASNDTDTRIFSGEHKWNICWKCTNGNQMIILKRGFIN